MVAATGALELIGAIGLLVPQTLPAAASGLIVLLAAMFPANVHAARAPLEAIAQFIGGGLFGLLIWWGNGKMRMPVDEVDATFRHLDISPQIDSVTQDCCLKSAIRSA